MGQLDSRDLVDELNELKTEFENGDIDTENDLPRLRALEDLIAYLENYCDEDPEFGIQLIPENEFTTYTEDLIDDCGYEIPKSNDWPYRHLHLDIEAAADELKGDYNEVDFEGVTYLCR